MNKHTLWLFVVILVMYFAIIFGDEMSNISDSEDSKALQSGTRTDLMDEARTRRHRHRLWHLWGWHALAIAYWIKVKLVIVAFFVGSAVFVALRYVWPHKCASSEGIHEGPIIYDHPPSFSHHDHVPYSFDHSPHFDHSFDTSGSHFDPYSAYSGAYQEDITSTVDVVPSTAPETHRLGRRSVPKQLPQMKMEEQIAEFMFSFLGLDSNACRRRFVCEMEFRSRLNPVSSMVFRIVGRGLFDKYTNARNVNGRAHSFAECAAVNPECVFIEQNAEDESEHEEDTNDHTDADIDEPTGEKDQNDISDNTVESHSGADADTNEKFETQNNANLRAERLGVNVRRRGDRQLNVVAERIMAQKNSQ